MLKIAIFDDEEIIVNYVENLIRENIQENIKIYKYTKMEEIKRDVKKEILTDIDIMYIDIKINRTNGIIVAEKLQRENPKLKVIFMTAFSQYSEEIFRTKPTYLLLKPIKKENFEKSLHKALQDRINDRANKKIQSFSVKGKIFNIQIDQVKYIESIKRVIFIYEQNFNRKLYAKLNEIQKNLPKEFVRCHQSYIVNLEKVKELNTKEFILNTGEKIPISQTRYKHTKESFIKYLGETL